MSYFTTRRQINCAHRRVQQLASTISVNNLFQNCKKNSSESSSRLNRTHSNGTKNNNLKIGKKFIQSPASFFLFKKKKRTITTLNNNVSIYLILNFYLKTTKKSVFKFIEENDTPASVQALIRKQNQDENCFVDLLKCGFGTNLKSKNAFMDEIEDEDWKKKPCSRCQWKDEKIGKKIDECKFFKY